MSAATEQEYVLTLRVDNPNCVVGVKDVARSALRARGYEAKSSADQHKRLVHITCNHELSQTEITDLVDKVNETYSGVKLVGVEGEASHHNGKHDAAGELARLRQQNAQLVSQLQNARNDRGQYKTQWEELKKAYDVLEGQCERRHKTNLELLEKHQELEEKVAEGERQRAARERAYAKEQAEKQPRPPQRAAYNAGHDAIVHHLMDASKNVACIDALIAEDEQLHNIDEQITTIVSQANTIGLRTESTVAGLVALIDQFPQGNRDSLLQQVYAAQKSEEHVQYTQSKASVEELRADMSKISSSRARAKIEEALAEDAKIVGAYEHHLSTFVCAAKNVLTLSEDLVQARNRVMDLVSCDTKQPYKIPVYMRTYPTEQAWRIDVLLPFMEADVCKLKDHLISVIYTQKLHEVAFERSVEPLQRKDPTSGLTTIELTFPKEHYTSAQVQKLEWGMREAVAQEDHISRLRQLGIELEFLASVTPDINASTADAQKTNDANAENEAIITAVQNIVSETPGCTFGHIFDVLKKQGFDKSDWSVRSAVRKSGLRVDDTNKQHRFYVA